MGCGTEAEDEDEARLSSEAGSVEEPGAQTSEKALCCPQSYHLQGIAP